MKRSEFKDRKEAKKLLRTMGPNVKCIIKLETYDIFSKKNRIQFLGIDDTAPTHEILSFYFKSEAEKYYKVPFVYPKNYAVEIEVSDTGNPIITSRVEIKIKEKKK